MSILIVPDQIKARLSAADAPIELCAADGQRLGFFMPAPPRKYNLAPPADAAELDAREAAGGGRPLADILRDLEKRA